MGCSHGSDDQGCTNFWAFSVYLPFVNHFSNQGFGTLSSWRFKVILNPRLSLEPSNLSSYARASMSKLQQVKLLALIWLLKDG